MKIEAFEFNSVQNFRTMAIIARRYGITDVDALIAWLDRYITNKSLEMKAGIAQPEPGITTHNYTAKTPNQKEQKKQQRQMRQRITEAKRIHAEKLQSSITCPECDNGRVIAEVREGVRVQVCTYPQPIGVGVFKFESGCGYSRMVD